MKWDHYEYKIASHYLPAMINGDYSGMTSEECSDYRAFEQAAYKDAREAGFTVGHWAHEDGEGGDYGTCAVSNTVADRATVKLMVYKE